MNNKSSLTAFDSEEVTTPVSQGFSGPAGGPLPGVRNDGYRPSGSAGWSGAGVPVQEQRHDRNNPAATSSIDAFVDTFDDNNGMASGYGGATSEGGKNSTMPESEVIASLIEQGKSKSRFRSVVRSTIGTLLVVAAIAALIAMFVLPIMQIHGNSMTPTINEGEIVVAIKNHKFQKGDVVGLYIGNKILVKRVIGAPADWIDIKSDGTVFVNGEMIDEPYITEKSLGDCNIDLPYQVPDGRYFVMGDHRETSADSRNTSIGCIADEQIVGRIIFRIWPLSAFGKFD